MNSEPLPWRTDFNSNMHRPTYTPTLVADPCPQIQLASNATNCFDVVGGRGQGNQRLPGNVKYRALISMNKVRRYIVCFSIGV